MAPTRMVRAYEVWPTKNVFCCWGHMMTGPIEDIGPNSCAWTSLLAPMACFFYVWGDVLWNPMEVPPVSDTTRGSGGARAGRGDPRACARPRVRSTGTRAQPP